MNVAGPTCVDGLVCAVSRGGAGSANVAGRGCAGGRVSAARRRFEVRR